MVAGAEQNDGCGLCSYCKKLSLGAETQYQELQQCDKQVFSSSKFIHFLLWCLQECIFICPVVRQKQSARKLRKKADVESVKALEIFEGNVGKGRDAKWRREVMRTMVVRCIPGSWFGSVVLDDMLTCFIVILPVPLSSVAELAMRTSAFYTSASGWFTPGIGSVEVQYSPSVSCNRNCVQSLVLFGSCASALLRKHLVFQM